MSTRAGVACRYRPVASLTGVPAVLHDIRAGYGLIEFEDHGELTTAEGYLMPDFHWRRRRWVPLCHIKEGTR